MVFLLPIQMNSAAVIAACIFTFLPFLYFSYVLSCRRNTSSGNRRVPKAGSAWPLIGHLHLLGGPELPHVTLGNMADKYGPIFAIQLGTHQAIVVSTWEMAQDCLSVNEKAFSSRPQMVAIEHMGYNHAFFCFSPYGPYWREMRKISVQQLLSNHTLSKFDSVRSYEMKASLKEIYDSWVKNEQVSEKILWDMKKWFQDLVLNLTLRIIVGKRREVNNEDRWLRVIREVFELLGVFTFSDAFSFLRPLDIGGYEKAMKKTGKEIDQLLQECLEEHKSNKNSGNNKDGQDFMDVMMSLLDDGRETFNLDPDTINKATCLAMISGSVDTTSITLTWALSLLLNNRHALKKAQDELDIHVGKNRPVEESDLKNLVYLQAIIKETLRLYPPTQLSPPRESIEDCTVGGFFVPKDIDWGELFPPAEDTLTKIEEFFRLPPDKRSPKGLLEASSTIPEDLKASTSAIMSTVSKPVVSGSDFDLDDIEAMFSEPVVKIEKKPPPAPKKIPVPDESIGIGSRVRKRKAIQEEVVEVEDTFEEMSVGDFKKKCMSFTTGAVGLMEGLVKETEIVKKKSKADIALVKKEKTMLENKIKEHEKTLAEQEQTVKDLLNSLAKSEDDHNKEIAEVKNSCKLAAAKTVSQCKVKMMKEYQEGKADTWDINRECAYLFKLTGEVTDEGEVSSSPYETIVKDAPVVGEVTPNATPAAEAT